MRSPENGDKGVRALLVLQPDLNQAFLAFSNGDNGRPIIDRLLEAQYPAGKAILQTLYGQWRWRKIYLPVEVPFL